MDAAKPVVVLVTSSSAEEAERIGRALVEEGLAACANILPGITSIFWWDGRVNREPESLLILKTREALFPRLEERVKALHSYSVPEIIALPLVAGSPAYLSWIEASTAPRRP